MHRARTRTGLTRIRARAGRFIKTSPRASHPKYLVIYYSATGARARINAAPRIEYLCAGGGINRSRRSGARFRAVSTLPFRTAIPRLVTRT